MFDRISPTLGRGHVSEKISINQPMGRSTLVKVPWLSSDGQRVPPGNQLFPSDGDLLLPCLAHSLQVPLWTGDFCFSQNRNSFAQVNRKVILLASCNASICWAAVKRCPPLPPTQSQWQPCQYRTRKQLLQLWMGCLNWILAMRIQQWTHSMELSLSLPLLPFPATSELEIVVFLIASPCIPQLKL